MTTQTHYLDPEHPATLAAEALEMAWDAEYPDWRERSLPREHQPYADQNDVSDPYSGFVTRYGSDDPGRYHPGCEGE